MKKKKTKEVAEILEEIVETLERIERRLSQMPVGSNASLPVWQKDYLTRS